MGIKKYGLFFLQALLFTMVACTPGHRNDIIIPNAPFEAHRNIVYGTDTVQQAMDVYLPIQRDVVNTPIIIMLHGGTWVRGDKNDFAGLGLDTFFTAQGCALVNMNYRLDVYYKYPAPVDDIGYVLDYIKQKAGEWSINPNRICLLGRSVGSQLALLYAYTRNKDNRIKVVIDGFGPTNLTDSSVTNAPLGFNVTFLLGPYSSNKQAWHDNSPVFYMAGAVPTVIFQGTADSTVYPVQSQILQNALLANGIPCMYISWIGDGHGWAQDKWLQCRDTTMKWVKHFVK
jgi:acetyl esterase/lipase